jgi:CO/xanthine dehydrogenase Mo-binding subunit
MLHAKAVFAHRPSARILRVDGSGALGMAGVRAVLTAADVPYNRFGLIESDQPLLCEDRVRYVGDRVALVVADTPEIAAAGAAAMRVEYEDLPVVSDPREALKPETLRVHGDRSNVLLHQRVRKGDVDRAFAQADAIVEGEFSTSWQEHAYLQPDAGIAYWDDRGRLVIETAGQWLHEDRRQIAAMFAMPEDRVVVRYAKIGGAFGGREDLSLPPLVALAAWKLRVPVAMQWSREESIAGHHKRHPFYITSKWAAKRDGTIVAARTRLVADGGAYASTSVEVLKCATIFATGPYAIPNVATDGIVCYTNNVPAGAFRGFGSPQAHFAAESMVTRLAEALGIDPVEIRRKNLYSEGDTESTGHPLPYGVSVRDVFERCLEEARSMLPAPFHNGPVSVRRGVGISCGIKNVGYSFGFPEQCTANVELEAHGVSIRGARVRIGTADVGQGAHLALRQIAAETLDLDLECVTMITDDSAEAPNAGSASASRTTLMGGRAVKDACEEARRRWLAGEQPAATVEYRPPRTTPLDLETGDGVPNYCYGYVAQAVEVEVDLRTGLVRVLRVVSVHDVGRAINRQQVEGQIEGCIAQAVGFALTENFICKDGKIVTPYLSTYLLPTALDMPEVHPIIVESADPNGPYGARGMAEMALVPFAPAVAAAIHDATGVWVSDLPMTPERVLRALREQHLVGIA